MTRDEFIAYQTLPGARRCARHILDDHRRATPALLTLAADSELASTCTSPRSRRRGLLRPEDATAADPRPAEDRQPDGHARLRHPHRPGRAARSAPTATSLDFFERSARWYGHDDRPCMAADRVLRSSARATATTGEIPVPALPSFDDYDLGLSQPTHFEAFRVYVPWMPFEERGAGLPADFQINGPEPVDGDAFVPLDLSRYFQTPTASGLASITGPQTVDTDGWLPAEQALPYTVNFANAPSGRAVRQRGPDRHAARRRPRHPLVPARRHQGRQHHHPRARRPLPVPGRLRLHRRRAASSCASAPGSTCTSTTRRPGCSRRSTR